MTSMKNIHKLTLKNELIMAVPLSRDIVKKLFEARFEIRDSDPELSNILSEAREEILALSADIHVLMGHDLQDLYDQMG